MNSLLGPKTVDTAIRWFEVAGKILYYISLPIVKLLLVILYILRLLLSPFLSIGSALVRLLLVPYNFLAKFEAVWYFLGVAIIIGIVFALIVHGILRTFVVFFRLDQKRASKPRDVPATGYDVKSYRKARENKRRQAEREEEEIEARARALASSPLIRDALKNMQHDDMIDPRAGRPDPLASLQQQTILEQTDEEDS